MSSIGRSALKLPQPPVGALQDYMQRYNQALEAWANGPAGSGGDTASELSAAGIFNVLTYGAKGDGNTDDSGAIARAITACANNGGGIIYFPPTGNAYALNTGIVLPNGCEIRGAGTKNLQGLTASISQWTDHGSWILCRDTVNPAVTLLGHGSAVSGINFIINQTVPGVGFTPITFPYIIKVKATLFTIENVLIANATLGIQIDYTAGAPVSDGGGTYSRIRDVELGCLTTCLQVLNVNDILVVDNVSCSNLWYETNSHVLAWQEANAIGFDIGYWDNAMINNVQFYRQRVGMRFTDGTSLGSSPHSYFNGQATNLTFNLVVGAMEVASGTTHVQGQFGNVILQTDDVLGAAATYAFDLRSNNVDVTFSNLMVNDAGKGVMAVGNGAGGNAYVNGVIVRDYSTLTNSNIAFTAGSGGNIYIASPTTITTSNGSAGAVTGGGGVVSLSRNTLSGQAALGYTGSWVGVGIYPPAVPFDVSGNTRFGNFASFVTDALTLANGANQNIALNRGRNRITGPTGAFSVGGFAAQLDGSMLWLHNPTAQAMTINNEDASSTAANRITTLAAGGNVTVGAANGSMATFHYDGTSNRWILDSRNPLTP